MFMEQSKCFVHDHIRRFVCKLKGSMHGLKDPRELYRIFDSFMVNQSEYNHCVYLKNLENGIFMLNVDNILVAGQIMVEISRLKAQVDRTFQMKDRGEAKQTLGIEVHREWKYGKFWL